MLTKFTALHQNRPNSLPWPDIDSCLLPAKMNKHVWVTPTQFVTLVHALTQAPWALTITQSWRPALPPPARQESIAAIPLLALNVLLFALPITLVRADSAYFTAPIMTFI